MPTRVEGSGAAQGFLPLAAFFFLAKFYLDLLLDACVVMLQLSATAPTSTMATAKKKPNHKTCKKCEQVKPEGEFARVTSGKKVYTRGICKPCRREYIKDIRKTNRSHYTKRQRQRRQKRQQLFDDLIDALNEYRTLYKDADVFVFAPVSTINTVAETLDKINHGRKQARPSPVVPSVPVPSPDGDIEEGGTVCPLTDTESPRTQEEAPAQVEPGEADASAPVDSPGGDEQKDNPRLHGDDHPGGPPPSGDPVG